MSKNIKRCIYQHNKVRKFKKKEKKFSYYLVFVTQMTLDLFISALFTLISIYTWDLERVLNRGEIVNGINSLNYRKKKLQERKTYSLIKHQLSKSIIISST